MRHTLAKAVLIAALGVAPITVATAAHASGTAGPDIIDYCSPGQVNDGLVYYNQVYPFKAFCNLGFFNEPSGGWTVTAFQPFQHNRWWFHGTYKGTAYSWCSDYTHEQSGGLVPVPVEYRSPANIQIAESTATC